MNSIFGLLRAAWERRSASQTRAPRDPDNPPLIVAGGKFPYGVFDAASFQDEVARAVPSMASTGPQMQFLVATMHLKDNDQRDLRAASLRIGETLVGHLSPALTERFRIGARRDDMDVLSDFSVNARVRRIGQPGSIDFYEVRIDLYEDWVGLPADDETGPSPAPSTQSGTSM